MAYYGYRLFEIELRALNGRTAIDFAKCGQEHYSVIANRILRSTRGMTVVEEKKAEDIDVTDVDVGDGVEGNPFAGRRGVRVLDVVREGHTVWVDVLAGRYGDLETAQGVPGGVADSDLKGRAPSDKYRLGFYFPTKGTRGVLVCEDISRTCPVDLVRNSLLLAGSKAEAGKQKVVKDGEPEKTPTWWKIQITPMIDEEQVRRLLDSGRSQQVQLTRHAIGAGRGRDALEYEFTAAALTDGQQVALARLVTQWGQDQIRRRRAKGEERAKLPVPSDSEGARELAALLGRNIEALNFDDGFVVVSDGENKPKKISPTRLNEVFTYPLSRNSRPSDVAFHERSRQTAMRLARSTRITGMEWPVKP